MFVLCSCIHKNIRSIRQLVDQFNNLLLKDYMRSFRTSNCTTASNRFQEWNCPAASNRKPDHRMVLSLLLRRTDIVIGVLSSPPRHPTICVALFLIQLVEPRFFYFYESHLPQILSNFFRLNNCSFNCT